jgi:DNA-binding NarL/FixJ family response regulator
MAFQILIADDHRFVRQRLRLYLEANPDWEVCAEAENGKEAIERAEELKPDLIILDLAMPLMDGFRAARVISQILPAVPVLLHTLHDSPEVQIEAEKVGISRVISKADTGNSLAKAINALLQNRTSSAHRMAVEDGNSNGNAGQPVSGSGISDNEHQSADLAPQSPRAAAAGDSGFGASFGKTLKPN